MSDATKLLLAGTAISLIGFDLYYYNYIYEAPPKSLNPDAFEAFDLAQITRINHDTSLFRIKARVLSLMEGGGTLPIPSHIIVKDDSCQIARAYSPVVYDKEYVDLLVKRYPDGSISRMLHDSKVGDKIWIRGPFSSMPYRSNVVKDLGMIAAGTGITPMYQLIKSILQDPQDQTRIRLVYANKTLQDVLLHQELETLKTQFPDRLAIYYTLETPGLGWNQGRGRVSKDMLQSHLPAPEASAVLVCGPDGFVQSVAGSKLNDQDQGPLKGILKELGYEARQVYKL